MAPRWKSVLALMCVFVAAVALAACGSDDDGGSTSSATTEPASGDTTAAGQAPSGAAIEIGLICGCTGPLATSLGEVPELVEVWEKATNEAGGINGHPVKVNVQDDQADPSKAATAARTLVSDGALAIVGSFSATSEVYSPYFASEEVPVIGGSSSDLKAELGTNYFPPGGNVGARDFGWVQEAKEQGNSKLAVFYCAELPACASVGELYSNIADTIGGIEVATAGSMSATAPNYIPQCLKVEESESDGLYIANGAPPVVKMLGDCQKQGVEVDTYEQTAVPAPEVWTAPGAEGMKIVYGNPPASDTSTPGGKYLNESIEKYAPEMPESSSWSEALTPVWASLQLFKIVGDESKLTPDSTREDVYNALYQVKDETIEGLSPPLTFEKGKPTNIPCWYTGTISDGRIVSDGAEPKCVSPADFKVVEEGRGL